MRYRGLLTVLILIALTIVVSSGFIARGDVVLGAFRETEDGSALTVEVDVVNSMGHVRSASEEQVGDCLYVKFYSAFGGHNGTLGARSSFELETPDTCREIYFFRDDQPNERYDLVLRRDSADAKWEPVEP